MTTSDCRPRRVPRILIAEDDFLIGDFMRDILIDLGYAVIGPFNTLEETLRAIPNADFDGALLDMQLGADDILPAARELAERDIPFILTTGRSNLSDLPAVLAKAPLLTKPFDFRQLEAKLASVFRCLV
jgi:DNA-binding response OmpR family regulator